ncbi:MAG: hypothetical protein P1U34_03260 [Coxiellaceae bacterium]|nr:hypothetical protein [Coxiellaceae bacterium]
MKKFLIFKTMVTPVILQIIFWLGVIAAVVFGLIDIILNHRYLIGVQLVILGPIGLRILIEILLIPFRINDKLDAIIQHKSSVV